MLLLVSSPSISVCIWILQLPWNFRSHQQLHRAWSRILVNPIDCSLLVHPIFFTEPNPAAAVPFENPVSYDYFELGAVDDGELSFSALTNWSVINRLAFIEPQNYAVSDREKFRIHLYRKLSWSIHLNFVEPKICKTIDGFSWGANCMYGEIL